MHIKKESFSDVMISKRAKMNFIKAMDIGLMHGIDETG